MVHQHSYKKLLLIFIGLSVLSLYAQAYKKISHLSGSKTINGIVVKTTIFGAVDSIDYCDGQTSPYFIGYDPKTSGSGNGRVTFHFSKPVNDVILNFAGTSDINGHYEEVIIFVNGKHHKLHAPGKKHPCEELALVNERGNLVGCKDCSVSGWNGTKINGPITTLTVIDTIITGDPNGTVFSILMSGEYIEQIVEEPISNTLTNYNYNLTEGAAGKEMVIESQQLKNAVITLKDKLGNYVPIHYQVIESNRVILDISDIPKGEYLLEFNLNGVIESQRILI